MAAFAIQLEQFLLHDLIGRGGMGDVFRGIHLAQRVPVAVKVLTSDKSDSPHAQAAFRNEVRAVARLYHRIGLGGMTH